MTMLLFIPNVHTFLLVIITMNERDKRNEFLCRIYEYVKPNINQPVEDIHIVAKTWGFTDHEIQAYAKYWEEKLFIQTKKAFGIGILWVRLTAHGVDYVEDICA